jgi:hypothetical protein
MIGGTGPVWPCVPDAKPGTVPLIAAFLTFSHTSFTPELNYGERNTCLEIVVVYYMTEIGRDRRSDSSGEDM